MTGSWCHSSSGDPSDEEEGAGEDADSEEAGDDGAAEEAESRVCIVTGDYAMQNVVLQMGLRLVAPDGKRIWQTRRWALRCSACFQICKVRHHAISPLYEHQHHPMNRWFACLQICTVGFARSQVAPRRCCHKTACLFDSLPMSLLVTAGCQVC